LLNLIIEPNRIPEIPFFYAGRKGRKRGPFFQTLQSNLMMKSGISDQAFL